MLVNPFESEKAEEIAAFNKEQGFTAPYVHDAEKTFAAALRARSTTEVFLLDAMRTLLYRGALDDQYGLSYNLDAPRVNYLRAAVSALLAGGRPDIAAPIAAGAENPWANDCSLSARDAADLLAWLGSANRPLGNPTDAPVPRKFGNEWSIGKPDLVLQLPKPFDIKAEGYMPYQSATVETKLTEDKWVTAYEVMPTAREVVHHIIVQVHEKGADTRVTTSTGSSATTSKRPNSSRAAAR